MCIRAACCLLKGEQQVLKWQIASRTTWINIDSGPVSLMMAHAGIVSVPGRKGRRRHRWCSGGERRWPGIEATVLSLSKRREFDGKRGREQKKRQNQAEVRLEMREQNHDPRSKLNTLLLEEFYMKEITTAKSQTWKHSATKQWAGLLHRRREALKDCPPVSDAQTHVAQ